MEKPHPKLLFMAALSSDPFEERGLLRGSLAMRKTKERLVNSRERHEARYQRRKKKRAEKHDSVLRDTGGFEQAVSLAALVSASRACESGVSWKRSVQGFCLNRVLNCAKLHRRLACGSYKPGRAKRFTISERGKTRDISAIPFADRVVQRALCDKVLLPVFSRTLIHDNGASLKGKGVSFALDRLEQHLVSHCRKFGVKGGILLSDFSKYFENIEVERLLKMVQEKLRDSRLIQLTNLFLEHEDAGLGLGNQTSQLGAILYASVLDHWIKDECGIKGYGRYMDDGYVLFSDWNEMKHFAVLFEQKCKAAGVVLNPKKYRFIRIDEPFVFLKTRFQVSATGKVVRRICPESVKREKRKLRKLDGLHRRGMLSLSTIGSSYASWRGTLLRGNASRFLQWKMDGYFHSLIGKSWKECVG